MDERDALRARLGRVGMWTFAFDELSVADVKTHAERIESLGFPALWVPEGSHSRDVFAHLSLLLGATSSITVASGIANITARAPDVMQAGAVTLADAFGERLVFGIGVGHQYSTVARGVDWGHPLERMRTYLDRMAERDSLPGAVVGPRMMLAALGPKMLTLAAERTLGAHTYFVPVEHTALARRTLGPEPVLAVEQTVVLDSDADRARSTARAWASGYLESPNYANNWRRLGFADELDAGPGDRLIDAAVAWGGVDEVAARVREHLDAGADHVCVQVLDGGDSSGLELVPELAPALLAS